VAEAEVPLRIAVIGAARATAAEEERARALGAALARTGAVVVCGGHGGVMAAAAQGSRDEGGWTVGILPGTDASEANPWIRIPLATGLGEARNALVVRAADVVLAVGGRWGTLSEIALAVKMGIPVGLMGTPPAEGLDLPRFDSVPAAVQWALATARSGRKGA
jgi:uncharacterized protein (TIGR00725 family)